MEIFNEQGLNNILNYYLSLLGCVNCRKNLAIGILFMKMLWLYLYGFFLHFEIRAAGTILYMVWTKPNSKGALKVTSEFKVDLYFHSLSTYPARNPTQCKPYKFCYLLRVGNAPSLNAIGKTRVTSMLGWVVLHNFNFLKYSHQKFPSHLKRQSLKCRLLL